MGKACKSSFSSNIGPKLKSCIKIISCFVVDDVVVNFVDVVLIMWKYTSKSWKGSTTTGRHKCSIWYFSSFVHFRGGRCESRGRNCYFPFIIMKAEHIR